MIAAIDIETCDPNIKKLGPGAMRRDGYIIGVGIVSPTVEGFYEPTDPIVSDILNDPSITKVFHNGVYDLHWLVNYQGLTFKGRIEDTMTREQFINALAPSFALDACCKRYNVAGKNAHDTIDQYWAGKGKAVAHLAQLPRDIVAKYCIQDCHATLDLFNAQQPILEKEGLLEANEIEVRLYPLLINMMGNGFPIDDKARLALAKELRAEYEEGMSGLEIAYGFRPSLNASADLVKIWEAENIPLRYTEKHNPCFTAEVLADIQHPVAKKIHHLRTVLKTLNTFLEAAFVDYQIDGSLHSMFYPARRDTGGTITGRWSSANMNLQQIPAREEKYGKEIRSLLRPKPGCLLGAFDYKQIEYRVFTHYAACVNSPGASDAVARFHADPNTDYHQMTIDLMGWGHLGKDGRRLAKNFNFGSIYGMGPRSFSQTFKWNLLNAHPGVKEEEAYDLARSLMNEYFAKVPFARPTANSIQETAQRRGFVKTLSGRRQRDNSFKVTNYLIQGSSADILKKGLVDAWEAGVFNVLTLHAVVHDENVFSLPPTREGYDACMELYNKMVGAYSLQIPLGVDTEIGPDWGHCDEENWNEFKTQLGIIS